jgi:tetratricopeptide (TPR) repeat protein
MDRWESVKAQKYVNSVLTLDPQDEFGFKEESELYRAIYQARFAERKDPQLLIAFVNQTGNASFLDQGYGYLIQYYRIAADTASYFATLEAAIAKLPDNTGLLNEYAWAVFKAQLASKYKPAIAAAEKAVQLKPDAAHIWDTLSWLYLVDGAKDKAVSAMNEAVKISPRFKERLSLLETAIQEDKINIADL